MASASSLRDRWFGALARWGTEHPTRVLGVLLLVVLAFAAVLPGLSVSTSRSGMVADDDPQQMRTNAFYERFGRPDYPLFVISGGTAQERRDVVDALQQKLVAQPQFEGRVFGRVNPTDIAGILLLQQPAALEQLAASMPPGVDAKAFIEGGLVGWIEGLGQQLEQGLEGSESETAGEGPNVEEAAAQLGGLAAVARVLQDVVEGKDPLSRFEDQLPEAQAGLDAKGYLVTADGKHNLLAVYAQIESDEGRDLKPLVTTLRQLRDEAVADASPDVRARLTGLPALAVDELGHVEDGVVSTSVAATIGIFGLCLLLFRSLRLTIVALVPLLPGILGTMAVVRVLYDDLNIITSAFAAVMLGLGIDFSVHVIARRNEEVREGRSAADAIKASLQRTGPGIFTGAVVTAAAFMMNATTEFAAFAELGVVTALGLIIMVVITFALIPPLLTLGRKDAQVRVPPEPPGLATLPGFVRRAKIPVIVVALIAAALGALQASSLSYNPRYFDFLPEDTESAQGLGVLEYDALASPVFASFVADDIETAREKAAKLRALDVVAGVQTPSDLLPPLGPERLESLRAGLKPFTPAPDFAALAQVQIDPKAAARAATDVADLLEEIRFALRGASLPTEGADEAQAAFASLAKLLGSLDEAQTARLQGLNIQAAALLEPAFTTARAVATRGHYAPEDVPPLFAGRFVALDGSAVALFAVPAGQFWEEDVAMEFAARVREVDPDAVGLAMVHVEHARQIRDGFQRAALYAAGVIVILLLIDFRSLRDALLALLPTVIGWLWMLGLMPVLGLDFNVANIVALPLVIGIGIAFGVHMLHRVRESDDGSPSLESVVRGTGGAIAVAATTTMVGFAALMLSAYGGMVSLGATMVLGIATCLVATLFVLPAVLIVLRRTQ